MLAASILGESAVAQITPAASERFADPQAAEVPDFQQHVVPLLGRLGCNGRACHGSFQGRGGFRLSLFGYDFAMDHAALVGVVHGLADLLKKTESEFELPAVDRSRAL